jgi:hypothetical protein
MTSRSEGVGGSVASPHVPRLSPYLVCLDHYKDGLRYERQSLQQAKQLVAPLRANAIDHATFMLAPQSSRLCQ